MLDFTTEKGIQVKLVFQNDSVKEWFENLPQEEVQADLADAFDQVGIDASVSPVLYAVVNDKNQVGIMEESRYVEWEADPEKSWYGPKIDVPELITGLMALDHILGNNNSLFDLLFGGDDPESEEFTGPTDEERALYLKDRESIDQAITVHNNDINNCEICLKYFCCNRDKSFNAADFEAAVADLVLDKAE